MMYVVQNNFFKPVNWKNFCAWNFYAHEIYATNRPSDGGL